MPRRSGNAAGSSAAACAARRWASGRVSARRDLESTHRSSPRVATASKSSNATFVFAISAPRTTGQIGIVAYREENLDCPRASGIRRPRRTLDTYCTGCRWNSCAFRFFCTGRQGTIAIRSRKSVKTRVLITIDTEFSIAGTFADPANRKPVGEQAVLCEIDGKSHGLGFILETFAASGTRATFFVEAFNSYYFGDEPMRALASRIKAAGQDVQLHLHPCWTYFCNPDWKDRLKVDPPTDHMHGRSVEQLTRWLSDGIAIFERWGLGRPLALRTGSMMADLSVYRAMERVGMRMGSNIGLALYRPPDSELHLFSGIHQVGEVTEACLLTYVDFAVGSRVHYRTLTITGASWSETRALLERAHESGVESVVILTHPFEYVKYDSPDFSNLAPNRINQQRLASLCRFIRDNPDRYEAATIADLAAAPR